MRTLRELREKDFGTWEGLTDEEILLRFPEASRGHWGDGETNEAMAGRVVAALRTIAERHPGARVLVVSHGGPLRAVLSPLAPPPATARSRTATSPASRSRTAPSAG